MLLRILGSTVVALALAANFAAARVRPRIVNGQATDHYPAVGMIAFYADRSRTQLAGLCSGSLIGCHTIVTAAHCVCPDRTEDYQSCLDEGAAEPETVLVFLPHVGVLPVERISVHPQYEFGAGYDVSLLHLAEPASGVPPLSLAVDKPTVGTSGAVIGYGTTGGGFRRVDDTGIKREGSIVFGGCPADVPADLHVCWTYRGDGANTCSGDSGGAVVSTGENATVLAGIVSGGSSVDCQAPDESFATAVASIGDWIAATGGTDVGSVCDEPGRLDDGVTLVTSFETTVASNLPTARVRLEVPKDALELRVTFNGQTGSASGFLQRDNDFDLLLRPDGGSDDTWVCEDDRVENWGACRIDLPQAGTWLVELRRIAGSGPVQITATIFRRRSSCPGDCNGDSEVDISEIVTAVNIALDSLPTEACRSADGNGDGTVTVDEVVQAVRAAISGCPARGLQG